MSDQPGCDCSICECGESGTPGVGGDDVVKRQHDLRTRIAAAIMSCHGVFVDDAVNAADAVIAELGLQPQVHYDPDCDYYRYVTDWIFK